MSWKLERHATLDTWIPVSEIPHKQRPRFTKNGRTYTTKKTRQFEKQIRDAWEVKHGTLWSEFEGPVAMQIETSRPLCKSNPKYWAGRQDLKKPDFDNIAKIVCDALNGLAYKDDAQIFEAHVHRFPYTLHGTSPRLFVRIDYYIEERI